MTVYYEPQKFPLAGGQDSKADTRALPSFKVAALENSVFDVRGQLRKRPGYRSIPAHTILVPENPYVPALPGTILGYDEYDAGVSPPRRYTFSAGRWREGRGIATRDDEVLTWTGTQLLSRTGQSHVPRSAAAFLPGVTSTVVAQYQTKQTMADCASTGVIDVYAWLDSTLGPAYAVYDTVTGACLVSGTALPSAPGTTGCIKVLSTGTRVHILVANSGASTIQRWTVIDASPLVTPSAVTLITSVSPAFDVEKISESEFIVAYILAANGVRVAYFNANGTSATTPAAPGTGGIDNGATTAVANGAVCVSVHPTTRAVLVGWSFTVAGSGIACRMFTDAMVPLTAVQVMHTGVDTTNRVTAAPQYLLQSDGSARFMVWISWTSVAATQSQCFSLNAGGSIGGAVYTRHRCTLQSRAFRVGHEVFIHLGRTTLFQSSYHLFDGNGVFHGTCLRGLAQLADNTTSNNWLPSVWSAPGTQTQPQNLVQQWVAGYKTRLNTSPEQATYTDEGLRRFNYDFGAALRWAQAGRCTYFQGLGLREYDGEALYEAGLHMFPEEVTVAAPSAGGSLTSGGVYQWRVYFSRRNAQGERVRSASLTFTAPSNPAGANLQVVITMPTLPYTSFPGDTFFEVFRTVAGGTTFYRESSIDPSSAQCPKNNMGALTVQFTSTMADTALDDREIDPFSQAILPSFCAPAGSVLAQGKDRLWVAGGELEPGVVVGSKILNEGSSVEFVADALSFTVDRAADDVTAMAFLGDSTVVFKRDSVYAVDGDGPSNQNAGSWPLPRKITTESGAVSPYLANVPGGVVFQSALGLRLLTGGGQVAYVGSDVEGEVDTLTGAVVVPARRHAVFTQQSGRALVYDFDVGQWSVFTNHDAAGAVLSGNLLHLCRPDGAVWIETPDEYLDAGVPYSQWITTGDMSIDTLQDVLRVRRGGLVGDILAPCLVIAEVRFNEGAWRNWRTWDTTTFQGVAWGGGDFWGSDDVWGGGQGEVDKLRVRHRLPRQVCSTIAFRIHDEPAPTAEPGAGFGLTQIVLEVGRRRGINRLGAARS